MQFLRLSLAFVVPFLIGSGAGALLRFTTFQALLAGFSLVLLAQFIAAYRDCLSPNLPSYPLLGLAVYAIFIFLIWRAFFCNPTGSIAYFCDPQRPNGWLQFPRFLSVSLVVLPSIPFLVETAAHLLGRLR